LLVGVLGTLLGEELGGGSAALSEVATQGTRGKTSFGDGIGLVEGEDAGDGAGRAMGLLALESFGAVEGGRGDDPGLALVAAREGLEAVEAVGSVAAFPAGEGGNADSAAGGVGDVVVAGGDLLPQVPLAAGRVLVTQKGQDEGVTEEDDLGALIFGIDFVGHGLTSLTVLPSVYQKAGQRGSAKLCWWGCGPGSLGGCDRSATLFEAPEGGLEEAFEGQKGVVGV